MAREFGAIHHRIWADPEWRALDSDSQLLYFLLLSQPAMNQAGVLPLQLRKWAGCVDDWDADTVTRSLHRLHETRFVVLDEDFEEVLVRSFIRNDGSYRIPGVLKSALKFAVAVQSPLIRTALAAELARLPELEGKTAAAGMASIAAVRAVLDPIGDGFPDPIKEPIPEPIADRFLSKGSPMGDLDVETAIPEPIAEPPLSGSGSVSLLSFVRNQGREGSSPALLDEPSPCKKHQGMSSDEIPPCRACGRLREQWETARAEASKPAPMPAWCGRCAHPTDRHLETPLGIIRCPECNPKASEPVNEWKSA